MMRKAAGEEPLPEEDPTNPIFKPLPEPSRLDSYLITNQIANYCNQINGYDAATAYQSCSPIVNFILFSDILEKPTFCIMPLRVE